jgi:acyl-coenzyme A thioesterase PaaI-like protein
MEIRDVDHETGTTTLRFEVSDARANQFGSVQGGVVATMLDACIGLLARCAQVECSQCHSPR